MSLPSLPALDPLSAGDDELGFTMLRIQQTSFQTWGFVVYRTAYGDDAAWARYLANMKREAEAELEVVSSDYMLGPRLAWTVVEDERALRGATRADVRRRFAEWVAARSTARDGPGADHPDAARLIARFQVCLIVDEECLESLNRTGVRGEPRVVAVRAPRASGGDGDDEGGMTEEDREELEEGGFLDPESGQARLGHAHEEAPEGDSDWIFVAANDIVSFYETLSRGDDWDYEIYRQAPPPRVFVP